MRNQERPFGMVPVVDMVVRSSEMYPRRSVQENQCPLDYGRHKTSPSASLGNLDKLPVEIQDQVLGELDIGSLLRFRAVNQRAMELVNSMISFDRVAKHCPALLRMAIAFDTAKFYTIKQLYKKICQKKCDYCGKPTVYIDVVDCKRRCFIDRGVRCNALPDFTPYDESRNKVLFQPENDGVRLEPLPTARSFRPFCFTERADGLRRISRQCRLVHIQDFTIYAARTDYDSEFWHEFFGPSDQPGQRITRESDSLLYDLLMTTAIWGGDTRHKNDTLVFAPWFNRQEQVLEPGFMCQFCPAPALGRIWGSSFNTWIREDLAKHLEEKHPEELRALQEDSEAEEDPDARSIKRQKTG